MSGPRFTRLLFVVLLLMALVAAAGSYGRWWTLPDRHNPFVPLVVREPPNWLTSYKLSRLDHEPALCLAVLTQSGAQVTPVPDHDGDGDGDSDCGWTNAVRLRAGASVALASPVVLSCRAAVSVVMWELHVLQPAAADHLGQPVRRLDHFGSYACRNVNNQPGGRRSRHALAEALDVAGLSLADGSRVSVLRDWSATGARSEFLQRVHRGACQWFEGVLGPAYNQAHADHLHLERGPWRVCR